LRKKKTFSILVVIKYSAQTVEYSRHVQEAGLPGSNTDPDNSYPDIVLIPATQLWESISN